MTKPKNCELCGLEEPLNFHHLIPRTLHSTKSFKAKFTKGQLDSGIWICRYTCHLYIHKVIREKEMGRDYNTAELLKSHPMISKYIAWKNRR